MKDILKFNQAIERLPLNIKCILNNISPNLKATIREVRFRSGRPLSVCVGNGELYVNLRGECTNNHSFNTFIIKQDDIYESFKSLCGYSVHTYQNEICNGYITINGGHRAGICGTAVISDGKLVNIRDLSSINLRIAREHFGASKQLINEAYTKDVCGLLIAGAPLSGKTTLLKDLIYRISSGKGIEQKKVCVVDERGELSAMLNGVPQNNIGISCDVLDGFPKKLGMSIAIRTMSPQIVVLDEIGDEEDAISIEGCLNSGVKVIATVHAGNLNELISRKHILSAIKTGAFEKIAFLEGAENPTSISRILTKEEVLNEAIGCNCYSINDSLSRIKGIK